MDNEVLLVFFDGSCGPTNPGGDIRTGIVFYEAKDLVIENKNTRDIKSSYSKMSMINCISQYFPSGHKGLPELTTNNVAEHLALNTAFQTVKELYSHYNKVIFFGDSEFVIKQMNFKYKVNDDKPYSNYARMNKFFAAEFSQTGIKTEFIWIPREYNMKADSLTKPQQ